MKKIYFVTASGDVEEHETTVQFTTKEELLSSIPFNLSADNIFLTKGQAETEAAKRKKKG